MSLNKLTYNNSGSKASNTERYTAKKWFKYKSASTIALVIISLVELGSCRRLNFKESLTAFAENAEPVQTQYYNHTSLSLSQPPRITPNVRTEYLTQEAAVVENENKNGTSTGTLRFQKHSPAQYGKSTSRLIVSSLEPTALKQFSLWDLTKTMLPAFEQKEGERFQSSSSAATSSVPQNDRFSAKDTHLYSSHSVKVSLGATREIAEQQTLNNFHTTTLKNDPGGTIGDSSDNENNAAAHNSQNMTTVFYLKGLGELEKQRSKKEVSSNTGLRDLLWNTASALWSVNKEHFLPTFLHTKTGGKLSLIRDSIFKPITILSQYKNGVQEINNEKWRNLARLTSTAGTGWSSPFSEVLVVKLQPQNSRLLTLLRYMLRLTKHTVITKYKLKRALLDLQFRALNKLIRILRNNNISQKIATAKILASALLDGKRAFLRILTRAVGENKANNPTGFYFGKDNSINVDLTYSSLGNDNNYKDSGWISNSYSYSSPSPPPPTPLSQYNVDSYLPQSVPPIQAIHTNYYHNPKDTPPLPLFPPSASLSYVPPTLEPLIEIPSYANVLKIMGINPTSNGNKYDDSNAATEAPSKVLYYLSSSHEYDRHGGKHNSPLFEKPAASYSYHYSKPQSALNEDLSSSHSSLFDSYMLNKTNSQKEHAVVATSTYNRPFFQSVKQTAQDQDQNEVITTTPSSFRLKLLEAMLVPT